MTVDTTGGNVVGHGPSTNGRQNWSLNFEIYVPPQAGLTLATVNGNITVRAGDDWQGQTLNVQTVNGNIELSVPGDCPAHVELSTVRGAISTNFPVPSWGMGPTVSFDVGNACT